MALGYGVLKGYKSNSTTRLIGKILSVLRRPASPAARRRLGRFSTALQICGDHHAVHVDAEAFMHAVAEMHVVVVRPVGAEDRASRHASARRTSRSGWRP